MKCQQSIDDPLTLINTRCPKPYRHADEPRMGSSAYLTSFFFPLPPPARLFFKYAGVPIVLGENVHSSASAFNLATFSSSYSRRDLDRTDPAFNPRVFF